MDLAKEFLASTDSMNKWCKERKLPHSTFHGWVKKYKAKQAPGDFVELVAPKKKMIKKDVVMLQKNHPTLLIEYHDFKLSIEGHIEPLLLEEVLKVVTSLHV